MNTSRSDSEAIANIYSANENSLLGTLRPTGSWAIDNGIGQTLIEQAIALDREKGYHGHYTTSMLTELSDKCDCWRGIRCGAYTAVGEMLSECKSLKLAA